MSAVEQYPKYAYYNFMTSTSLELGSFKTTGQLGLFDIRILHKNASAYSYQLRVVFSDREGGPTLASTSWETFSNSTTGQVAGVWLGHCTFTPTESYILNSAKYLFARLESTGYTYDEDTVYIAVACDWFEPIGATDTGAAKMAIGVYA